MGTVRGTGGWRAGEEVPTRCTYKIITAVVLFGEKGACLCPCFVCVLCEYVYLGVSSSTVAMKVSVGVSSPWCGRIAHGCTGLAAKCQ